MTERLELEARLDLSASERLVTHLAGARGRAITLDASAVDHLGAHAVQTLIVARNAWERDQKSFVIDPLSERAGEALATLGIDPADLTWKANT